MVQQAVSYALDESCPCCIGQGSLVFIACPNCEHVVLICEESQNVFERNDWSSGHPEIRKDDHDMCSNCGKVQYAHFRSASRLEVKALGYTNGRIVDWDWRT